MSDSHPFCHLHCHTHYSLLDGASRIPELVQHVKALGMNSCAITDHGNLYGAIEFYSECKKGGINPIVGYEAYVAHGSRTEKKASGRGEAGYHLTLLAKNNVGFKNLIKLASIASLEGYYYVPRIDKGVLEAHAEGLICLSGCASSEFSRLILKDKMAEAAELAGWFARVFGDNFYVEIQSNGLKVQRACATGAIDIANRMGLPLVATSDAHYLTRGDSPAHEVLLCINTGSKFSDPDRMRYGDDEPRVTIDKFYVCEPAEMYARFPGQTEAVRRSQEIADGCDLKLDFSKRHFPVFATPAGKSPEAYLRELCYKGLRERYGDPAPANVVERLEHELGIVCRMGFAGYFLIVWDFVNYGREQGIPSGARGSAVGAVISYTLYLSHVCPLEHNLLFERFLDPSRAEAPDIDIDLCQQRRDEVIQYVRRKYGEESVAQIATFGTLGAKAAIRDVARVMDLPLADADRLAKLIPEKVGTTIDGALKQVTELTAEYEGTQAVAHVIDIARKLEGTNRQCGVHAAGVVISAGPLVEHVPLHRGVRKGDDTGQKSGESVVATQWVMGDLEKVGLLKVDFLGLRTLTLLDNAVRLIRKTRGEVIDLHRLPQGDRDTYALLQKGDTRGVFQLESDGIRELIKRMKPDRLGDLIAVVALYRPGPLDGGMVDDYVNRKHGREPVPQVHPEYDAIVAPTYGVVTYQEDCMRILNILGGIELAKAYACIKAISKKKQELIDSSKATFVAGAKGRLGEAKAEEIFDLIAKFGGYGFNKSHAAAYADVTYKTAFLKAHYLPEFTAALLSSDTADRDTLVEHIEDARRLGVAVLPPDINSSDVAFGVDEKGRVVFGLLAVKGVGEAAAREVVAAREDGGVFRDLYQLCGRLNPSACGKGALEKLVKAGALDGLLGPGQHRAQLVAALPGAVESSKEEARDRAAGQRSLLDLLDALETPAGADGATGPGDAPLTVLPEAERWSEGEMLRQEKEALDLYLSSHPLAQHEKLVRTFASHQCSQLSQAGEGVTVVAGGIITNLRLMNTKSPPRGGGSSRYARFKLEDLTGSIECVMWPDTFAKHGDKLTDDAVVFLKGSRESNRDQPGLIVAKVVPLADAPRQLAHGLALRLHLGRHGEAIFDKLLLTLKRYKGGDTAKRVPVHLVLQDPQGRKADIQAGEEWNVNPPAVDVAELEEMLGADNVRFMGIRRPPARVAR